MNETPQNPRNSVSAAFDSVNLINNTIPSTGMTVNQKLDILKRNSKHLEIMMAKEWFVGALINNEGSEIQSAITAANNFINSNE
jgi:hypothetical protein